MSSEPIRTCLLCRSKNSKLGLLRFVRSFDGEIIFDKNVSLPGRGAWLCPSYKCLNYAFLKKILFRDQKNLPFEPEQMIQKVVNKIKESVDGTVKNSQITLETTKEQSIAMEAVSQNIQDSVYIVEQLSKMMEELQ